MNLLSKLLEKRGIDKIEDLAPEEKVIYDRWNTVLRGETVTVASIKEFCTSQIKLIEEKFASGAGEEAENSYLKACLHVYLNILKALEAPEVEREAIERHLVQLINS